MPTPIKLLAKDTRYGELTLEQHLTDTAVAARAIFRGRILDNWCRFFRVSDRDAFLLHLFIAALFHDLGKANADFYGMVIGQCRQQALRHESISTLMLHLSTVRSWLQSSGRIDCDVVTAAVLCHHLKSRYGEWAKTQAGDRVELYLQHPEVRAILQQIGELLQITGVPELPNLWEVEAPTWADAFSQADWAGKQLRSRMRRDDACRSLVMAVKAGLIAADTVASGIFRTRGSAGIEQWVNATLHQSPISAEELETKILQPRYAAIARKTRQAFALNDPQQQASSLGDRVLTLMACGSGKTLFAYKWMQGVLDRHELGRLIFLYPTRGTATEGFRDYVAWAPETEASLVTSTADYELQAIQKNPPESARDKNFQGDARLYALQFWEKRFFSATVDQFLSFLTHRYSSICLLPVLVDSALVIDEVHSFSKRMFESLTSLLTEFDHPVLCMTATLPVSRQQDLTMKQQKKRPGTELVIFPQAGDTLDSLQEAQTAERYNIHPLTASQDREQLLRIAIAAYRNGQRVLWVVNTVNRCRELAQSLTEQLAEPVLVYHSRFRLMDRQKRHDATVRAFAMQSSQPCPAIAVTTQVCEMSLDLDADVLITEQAPITSLIQRFGRANRHRLRGKDFQAQVYIYSPETQSPYGNEDFAGVEPFLQTVAGVASQEKLAQALQKHSPRERSAQGESAFTQSSYWAVGEEFRETNDYSVSAVLDRDLPEIQKCINAKKPIDGFILPVPQHQVQKDERPAWLPKYLAIADSTLYCEQTGFGK
ncbi:MAG: CRISPR-associated helicase Cas3' [Spirulinaceae cyanobacterium SM2_1_0]|nr:CRISPR-associated helicase Cas3' [Spirulinaceae cyanobacterium SM2_1_0]